MASDGRRLFWRGVAMTALPPLAALPFWIADVAVSEWAGSLGLYEVVAVPILLGLAGFTFYRKVRRFDVGTYLLALGGAAAVAVGLWYLGLGLHRGTLLRPDRLTVELMGIALGVQLVAAVVAVLVIAGVQRMREAE
jgi:hypothetical protein